MVCLALELVGPWVVLGFSVGMEAFDELLSINVPWSQEFSGVLRILDLSLLPLVFSLILTVASRLLHLLSKTMGCLSGCLMSSASIQKLFCGICSAFKCSFDEFVGEKVVSPSYSSAILALPSAYRFLRRQVRWSVVPISLRIFHSLFFFFFFGCCCCDPQ